MESPALLTRAAVAAGLPWDLRSTAGSLLPGADAISQLVPSETKVLQGRYNCLGPGDGSYALGWVLVQAVQRVNCMIEGGQHPNL